MVIVASQCFHRLRIELFWNSVEKIEEYLTFETIRRNIVFHDGKRVKELERILITGHLIYDGDFCVDDN